MNDRLRRGLALLLAGALLAAGGVWSFLKLGRPAFYSDGVRELRSLDLRGASVLLWSRPEPEAELPGPVQGRVQDLPDGRLLYGRALADGTTDLVLFDPRRPGAVPEAVVGLNSAGHDLAPALADDGTLYFSSDRPGGAGGFDLYTSRWNGTSFQSPQRMPDTINTPDDEADPAPAPGGVRLVFVRREPEVRGGRNGRLMTSDAAGESVARPVLAEEPGRRVVIDRDPTLAPDGSSLWFVRQVDQDPPLVMRSTVHLGTFGAPLAEEQLNAGGAFRGPAFVGDGFHLRLLAMPGRAEAGAEGLPAAAETTRLYLARARAVLPWWEGQRELESFLVSFVAFCFGLLVMLWLGQRWKQLDLITQCLLLSLLVHLLVLVWMRRVEILQQVLPTTPRGGNLEVEIVGPSGSGTRDVGGGNGGAWGQMSGGELSAMAQFPAGERTLSAAAPGSGLAPAAASATGGLDMPEGPGPQLAVPSLAPGVDAPALQDVAAAAPTRAGRESLGAPAAAAMSVAAEERNAVAAAQERGTDGPIQVPMPGAGGGGGSGLPAGGRDLERMALAAASGAGTGTGHGSLAAGGGSGTAPVAGGAAPHALGAGAMPVADAVAGDPGEARAGSGSGDGLPALQPTAAGLLARGQGTSGTGGSALGALPAPTRLMGEGGGSGGGAGALMVRAPIGGGLMSAPRTLSTEAAQSSGSGAAGGGGSPTPSARTGVARASSLEDRPDLPVAAAPRGNGNGSGGGGGSGGGSGSSGEGTGGAPGAGAGAAGGLHPMGLSGAGGAGATGGAPAPARPGSELAGRGPAGATVSLPGSLLAGAHTPGGGAAAGGGAGSGGSAPALAAARRGPAAPGPGLRDAAGSGPESGAPAAAGPAGDRVAGGGRGTGWPAPAAGALALGGGPTGEALPRPPGMLAGDAVATARSDGGIHVPGSFLDRAQRQLPTIEPSHEPARMPGVYANRFGAQKAKALDTFGGTEETEKAVRLGLQYLARVQNRNGSWGNEGIAHPKYGQTFVGKTGLCLLALLGAGHTPQSGTEHSENAERAVRWLLATQDQDTGHFGTSCAYSHGITTYALAECFALTKDERIKEPLTRGVAWILKNQSRARSLRNQGGWGYFSNHLEPEDSFSRVSVSAWQVMALESARLSGLEVPDEALSMARRFLVYCFDARNGYFLYNYEPSRLASTWRTLPASTPAASFCLQLLGVGAADQKVAAGLRYTLERAPREYRRYNEDEFVRDAGGNVYYWYYGSLACFLAGGETWEQWNAALKAVLPQAQGQDGSFRPIDPYAAYAGDNDRERAYTTAMCVLSLEVYYRYFTPLLKPR